MKNVFMSHHPLRHARSFKHAFEGIWHALLNEANFRVQILIVFAACSLGVFYRISNTEWGLLVLSMGALLAAEIINTVVEEFIDVLIKEQHEGAKVIKDMSAGFVLIAAAAALVILYLIFGQRLFFQ
jgi:diacylglycerol kinase